MTKNEPNLVKTNKIEYNSYVVHPTNERKAKMPAKYNVHITAYTNKVLVLQHRYVSRSTLVNPFFTWYSA